MQKRSERFAAASASIASRRRVRRKFLFTAARVPRALRSIFAWAKPSDSAKKPRPTQQQEVRRVVARLAAVPAGRAADAAIEAVECLAVATVRASAIALRW